MSTQTTEKSFFMGISFLLFLGFFNRVQGVARRQNPDVKVLVAIGGWTDSETDTYSRMVATASSREKFIDSAVSFVKTHGFDGLSVEWLYPVCWQSKCNEANADDKDNISRLLRVRITNAAAQNQLLFLTKDKDKIRKSVGKICNLDAYLNQDKIGRGQNFGSRSAHKKATDILSLNKSLT